MFTQPEATAYEALDIQQLRNMYFPFASVIEILQNVKERVHKRWLTELVTEFAHIYTYDELSAMTKGNDYRKFENQSPEIVDTLLSLITKREKTTVAFALDALEATVDDCGLSRPEMQLFCTLQQAVQPVDDIFLGQQQYVDGRKKLISARPNLSHPGEEYLYDGRPFVSQFSSPDEIPLLINNLRKVHTQIKESVVRGELRPHYLDLADYLLMLADTYAIDTGDPTALKDSWNRAFKKSMELAQAGLPILVTPGEFVLDSGHLGVELMVTLNLSNYSIYTNMNSVYSSIASQIDPSNPHKDTIYHYLYTVNGSSKIWPGVAIANEYGVSLIVNETIANAQELFDRFYGSLIDGQSSRQDFVEAYLFATQGHEIGHLIRALTAALYARMGDSLNTAKIEEAKADFLSIYCFQLILDQYPNFISHLTTAMIEQYIIGYTIELINEPHVDNLYESPSWYSFDARWILFTLFDSGAIAWSGDKLRVLDAPKGLCALSDNAQQLIKRYDDLEFDSVALAKYVQELEKKFENNNDLQMFLDKLQKL